MSAQLQSVIKSIISDGVVDTNDRTGIGVKKLPSGASMRFNMSDGFPLHTLRRINFNLVVGELKWMLSGSTSVKELREKYGVNFWDPWANKEDNIGPMYGYQLRNFGGDIDIDQLSNVIHSLRTDPSSRRHIMTTFNPKDANKGVLWPCHGIVQQFIPLRGKLNLIMYQRSADVLIGVPFNIAYYALLLHIMSRLIGLEAGILTIHLGDAHIYLDQLEAVDILLERDPIFPLPSLNIQGKLETIEDIFACGYSVDNYNPHGRMKINVAV